MDRKENFLKTAKELDVKENEVVERNWTDSKLHTDKMVFDKKQKDVTGQDSSYAQDYQQGFLSVSPR